MILPSSYLFTILLLVLGMFCWGSWANTFKSTGTRWRFELFYMDFALGAAIATTIAVFTLGSLGWDGFSFLDDIRNAGKKQDLYAFLAGAVFNLANMLILGAVSVSGISTAFPIGIGLALVVGAVWNFFLHPGANMLITVFGCGILIAAVMFNVVAFRNYQLFKQLITIQQGKAKSTKQTFTATAVILAGIGGLLMGCYVPLLEMSRDPDVGLGPYSAAFIFSIGMFFTTFLYNLFFMNLPVQGKPVDLSWYFKGAARVHYLGLIGGALWAVGLLANLVASRAEGPAAAPAELVYGMTHGGGLVSALWGLVVWREYDGAEAGVRTFMSVMMVLFLFGTVLVSIAPLFPAAH
jgi:glucose uptake protein